MNSTTHSISQRNLIGFNSRQIFLGLFLATLVRLSAQTDSSALALGDLVDVGGHKMFIQCEGSTESTPVVVFEAGGGGTSKDWARVKTMLSTNCRICTYDRAGSGRSEPGPAPRTMHQEVFELHELLKTAKITGPIVLIGQSLGGLLNRLYAEQYGSNVVGMVLVDPTDENGVLASLRFGGWVRLREKATSRPLPEPRLQGKATTSDYRAEDDYMAEEFQSIYDSRRSNPQPLGDRPLIVLGAGKRPQPPGVSAEQWQIQRQERDDQVRSQARLSRNSRFILDPNSGHSIHIDNPQLVAKAVEEVLGAVSKGTALDGSSSGGNDARKNAVNSDQKKSQ